MNNLMRNTIIIAAVSFLFCMSIYHCILGLRRKDKSQKKYLLFISTALLVNALYILNNYIFQYILINKFWRIDNSLDIIFTSASILFYILFFHEIFSKSLTVIEKGVIIILNINILIGLIIYFIPKNIYDTYISYSFLIIYSIAGITLLIIIIPEIIYQVKKKNLKKFAIPIAILITSTAFAFNGINSYIKSDYLVLIYCISYVFSCAAYSFLLAEEFNIEHNELKILTDNLEVRISERTKELEEANETIKKATEEKINFFINYTHENRTPLTIIDNNLNLHIKNKGVTPELSHVKYNVDKLKHNTNNLLDFEKLERSKIFYDNDNNINLSDLLNTKIDMFDKIADNKNIKIIRNIEKNISVDIDNYAMDRIINNLLDNALKYTDKNGKITVLLKLINKKINFIVKDTGIGISKKQINNIFKPYHQLSHKKRNIQGIGMGLNIVKKILDEVNGEINVESELNKGSTFTIILNKSMKKRNKKINKEDLKIPIPIVKVDLLEEKYDKDKQTILIVEDDLEIIELLQKFFYDIYNIYYSINGKEAINKINLIPIKPDLIISDIMMDEMDGYEFYEKLFEIKKYNDVPFIFLTAKVGEKNRINGLKKGAVDFIEKPFNIEDLKLKLNNLIKLKKEQVRMTYLNLDKERKRKFETLLKVNNISDIEKSIILYVNDGLYNKEIASKLKIAEQTVKNYLSEIYKKLNVGGRTDLIKNIQDYCN